MATGLGFDDCKEFVPNTKCIIFSILMALMYWLKGKEYKSHYWKYALGYFTVFIVLSMWYINYYECGRAKWFHMIIMSTLLSSFYTFIPARNYYILFAILYFSYLYMSWFDYIFDCQYGKLEPTPLPFGRYIYKPFKDVEFKAKYDVLCQEKKSVMDRVDTISFLLLVGIIFTVILGKFFTCQ